MKTQRLVDPNSDYEHVRIQLKAPQSSQNLTGIIAHIEMSTVAFINSFFCPNKFPTLCRKKHYSL